MRTRFYTIPLLVIVLLALTACGGDTAADPTPVMETEVTAAPEAGATTDPTTDPAPETGTVAPRYFTIVPADSEARYSVQEEFLGQNLGLTEAVGVTNQVEGTMELTIDPAAGTVVVGENEITVNIESLTSDDNMRDNRIRGEWLESSSYPLATFVATGIENFPAGAQVGQPVTFQLVGDLTIREVTNPVTFETTATLGEDSLRGEATTVVLMRDFGFEPPNIADIVAVTDGVTVNLTFVLQES